MVTVGIDTHERSRMVVVVDKHARDLRGSRSEQPSRDHLQLLAWAAPIGVSSCERTCMTSLNPTRNLDKLSASTVSSPGLPAKPPTAAASSRSRSRSSSATSARPSRRPLSC